MRTVVFYSNISELFNILVCRMWAEEWTVTKVNGEQVDMVKKVRSYEDQFSLVPMGKLNKGTRRQCRELIKIVTGATTHSLQEAFEVLVFSKRLAAELYNSLNLDDQRKFTQVKVLLQKRNESRL